MFRANHPALLTPSSLALRAATTPTAPVDGPHPRDLPENQYSYRPPPQPPSDHPASQPPPALPTFHVTHPLIPFSSADSHSGFAALSHAVPLSPTFPLSIPRIRRCVSLSITLTLANHRLTIALYPFVPLPFPFLLSILFALPLAHPCPSFVIPPWPPPVSSPLNMPQGLVVSLGLACRLGQPPLLAKRSSKAAGAGKA